ncbi:MAG: PadR family transcriptional regulator [Acidobacteria bacterium]|nr:PadR family transcriptional regulator [Acidobacteriota bacterium]
MSTKTRNDALSGSLTLLVLKTLALGEMHGYAIASRIQQMSSDLLRVEEGSLYPALHRMEQDGWISSHWGLTESNRRARFYTLTKTGQQQLEQELESWRRITRGVSLVLEAV